MEPMGKEYVCFHSKAVPKIFTRYAYPPRPMSILETRKPERSGLS